MTKFNWQRQIDEELGDKKWNDALSKAIHQKAIHNLEETPKTPVFIPFILVAMVAILVLISLSYLPNFQQSNHAAVTQTKFQEVYFSKLPSQNYTVNVDENLRTIGMTKTSDPELLRELSIAYEGKSEIHEPTSEQKRIMGVILVDEVEIKSRYNISQTVEGNIIFQHQSSLKFYEYNGSETVAISKLLEKQINFKIFIIIAVIFIGIILIIQPLTRKYYGVSNRKETFDHISLNRWARWLPLPYILYINFKLAIQPITLTWWEVLIPFIVYQTVVLLLMKQQKEPHPYIVDRMLSFSVALVFIIILMFML